MLLIIKNINLKYINSRSLLCYRIKIFIHFIVALTHFSIIALKMKENAVHLKFTNRQNPNAEFDLLRMEDLFDIAGADHSPDELHVVGFYNIIFVESGQGYHTIDFTDYACEAGTILTIRKDQLQKFFRSNMTGSMLLFTDEFLVSYLEQLETLKSLQIFNEQLGVPKIQLSSSEIQEFSNLIKRMRKEYFNTNDNYSLEIIRSELHILITKLYRIKSKQKQIVVDKKYLSEFIEFQKLVEHNVKQTTKVQDYAKMMGLSTKTLNNISKTILHKTAKEFVDEICTKQIKRLLINTELSIKEISFASGFEETTNFYKYFKRQTQTTPEQFRLSF